MAEPNPPEVHPFLTPEFASAEAQVKIATLRKYDDLGWRASDTTPEPPKRGDIGERVPRDGPGPLTRGFRCRSKPGVSSAQGWGPPAPASRPRSLTSESAVAAPGSALAKRHEAGEAELPGSACR